MSEIAARAGFAPWIQYARAIPGADLVLICFPHAGGAASAYRGWITALGDHGIEVWPVQLPGREGRFGEPVATDLSAVITELADLLHASLAGRPYAICGHSAGAMMAYALALGAATDGRPGPCHLFLGACRPLSRPDPDFPIHKLPRQAFLNRLFGYGRMPAEILDYPDLAELTIATTRADLRLVEAHRWSPGTLVHCPVTAYGGAADGTVPVETLADWHAITTGTFDTIVLPGGHFPAPAAEQWLLEVIRRGCG